MKFDTGKGVIEVPEESIRKLIEQAKAQGKHDLAAVLEEQLEKP